MLTIAVCIIANICQEVFLPFLLFNAIASYYTIIYAIFIIVIIIKYNSHSMHGIVELIITRSSV